MDEQTPKPAPPRITDVKPPEPMRSSTATNGVVEAPAEQTAQADTVPQAGKSATAPAPSTMTPRVPRAVPLVAIGVAVFCFVVLSVVAFMAYSHGA